MPDHTAQPPSRAQPGSVHTAPSHHRVTHQQAAPPHQEHTPPVRPRQNAHAAPTAAPKAPAGHAHAHQ
ncbi:hypothetical protein V491_01400 [Pseudogymnoascus sp. VKM F-3775]|nr:hypothetical protein V491_01400 [Pseudogymnoascus sp. VKM F-3775]